MGEDCCLELGGVELEAAHSLIGMYEQFDPIYPKPLLEPYEQIQDLGTTPVEPAPPLLNELAAQMAQLNVAVMSLAQGQQKLQEQILQSAVKESHTTTYHPISEHEYRPCPLPHLMHAQPSKDIAAKAVRGEYVSLEDFAPSELLPPNDILESHVSDGVLAFRPKNRKKSLDTFDKWLAAWTNYEICLVTGGHDFLKMAHHRSLIQMCNRKYLWSSIYTYDVKFRMAKSEYLSVDFSTPVGDLYTTCFDATAIKPSVSRCLCCKSMEHHVTDCPFPARETMEKEKARDTTPRWFHNQVEGCNNFNAGRCTYSGCRRAHVCRGCKGPQPQHSCPNCQRQQISSQAQSSGF